MKKGIAKARIERETFAMSIIGQPLPPHTISGKKKRCALPWALAKARDIRTKMTKAGFILTSSSFESFYAKLVS